MAGFVYVKNDQHVFWHSLTLIPFLMGEDLINKDGISGLCEGFIIRSLGVLLV